MPFVSRKSWPALARIAGALVACVAGAAQPTFPTNSTTTVPATPASTLLRLPDRLRYGACGHAKCPERSSPANGERRSGSVGRYQPEGAVVPGHQFRQLQWGGVAIRPGAVLLIAGSSATNTRGGANRAYAKLVNRQWERQRRR